jgi:hypothetical protein
MAGSSISGSLPDSRACRDQGKNGVFDLALLYLRKPLAETNLRIFVIDDHGDAGDCAFLRQPGRPVRRVIACRVHEGIVAKRP